MKNGPPTKAVTTPRGTSAGDSMVLRDEVGEDEERRATDDRDGQHDAVARVRREAHEVGHDDAHESDESAHRHRCGGPERRGGDHDESHSAGIDPKARRFFFAESQHVEQPTVHERARPRSRRRRAGSARRRTTSRPSGCRGSRSRRPEGPGRAVVASSVWAAVNSAATATPGEHDRRA